MNPSLPRLVRKFFDSLRPLKLVMVSLYAVLCISFYFRRDGVSDAELLMRWVPWYFWSFGCFATAVIRGYGLFKHQGPFYMRIGTPVAGAAFWSLLLGAALTAENFGFSLMYIVCASIEVWIGARALTDKRKKP